MAYYTVCHLLQGGVLDGSQTAKYGIRYVVLKFGIQYQNLGIFTDQSSWQPKCGILCFSTVICLRTLGYLRKDYCKKCCTVSCYWSLHYCSSQRHEEGVHVLVPSWPASVWKRPCPQPPHLLSLQPRCCLAQTHKRRSHQRESLLVSSNLHQTKLVNFMLMLYPGGLREWDLMDTYYWIRKRWPSQLVTF